MTIELVERSRAGDKRAFEALIGMYWRRAEAVAAAVVNGDQHAIDDVVQESFIRAYDKLESLSDDARFGPWLLRIVRNQAVTWLRRHAKVSHYQLDQVDASQQEQSEVDEADADPWVVALPQALAALRPADREMLTLKYQAGLDYQQISESLGISLAAVEKRLYRARRRLEQQLSQIALSRCRLKIS